MKRLAASVLAAIGLLPGCSRSDVLTPGEFTSEFAAAVRNSNPALKPEVARDLQLKLIAADGGYYTVFLDNAYSEYQQSPESKEEVLEKHLAAALEMAMARATAIDRTRIVPIIKDRPWLEEIKQSLRLRGVEKFADQVYDDLNSDLIIVYAEDSPKSVSYITPEEIAELKVDRKQLRSLACDNLRRLLPKIEQHGADGVYVMTAGGTYEASLLLLDSIWQSGRITVDGDIVVAIPTRDLLIITGSKSRQGLEKMRQLVAEAFNGGSYRLTQKLFVYRNGKFEALETNLN